MFGDVFTILYFPSKLHFSRNAGSWKTKGESRAFALFHGGGLLVWVSCYSWYKTNICVTGPSDNIYGERREWPVTARHFRKVCAGAPHEFRQQAVDGSTSRWDGQPHLRPFLTSHGSLVLPTGARYETPPFSYLVECALLEVRALYQLLCSIH